jgi:hypothetical protein
MKANKWLRDEQFIIFILHQILLGWSNRGDEMGAVFSIHETEMRNRFGCTIWKEVATGWQRNRWMNNIKIVPREMYVIRWTGFTSVFASG